MNNFFSPLQQTTESNIDTKGIQVCKVLYRNIRRRANNCIVICLYKKLPITPVYYYVYTCILSRTKVVSITLHVYITIYTSLVHFVWAIGNSVGTTVCTPTHQFILTRWPWLLSGLLGVNTLSRFRRAKTK